MRKYLFILLLFLTVISANVENAAAESSEVISSTINEESENKTSKQNRENQNIQLLFGPGYEHSFMGAGFKLGYYFNSDSIVEISWFDGSEIEEERKSIYDDIETVYIYSIGIKVFTGNSLYLKPGLFYGTYRSDYQFNFFDLEKNSYQRKDIGGSIAIGNQWQWKRLTFGIEWLGINSSLYNLNEQGEDPGFPFSIRINDSRWVTFNLTTLNIGVSF